MAPEDGSGLGGSNEPNTTETAQENVPAPDRAEEHKVDVSQNDQSVAEDLSEQTPANDSPTQTNAPADDGERTDGTVDGAAPADNPTE